MICDIALGKHCHPRQASISRIAASFAKLFGLRENNASFEDVAERALDIVGVRILLLVECSQRRQHGHAV